MIIATFIIGSVQTFRRDFDESEVSSKYLILEDKCSAGCVFRSTGFVLRRVAEVM